VEPVGEIESERNDHGHDQQQIGAGHAFLMMMPLDDVGDVLATVKRILEQV